MQDLVLLVADKNAQFAISGALHRPQAMGIRSIEFVFLVHPGRDGGTRETGPDILKLEASRFRHAIPVLDLEGSGSECSEAVSLEQQLDKRLTATWQGRAKSIVITQESDIWLWGSDNAMQQVLRWTDSMPIRAWLQEKGFEFTSEGKPTRPKEAFEEVVRKCQLPRSSSLYSEITGKLSLSRCTDSAYQRLSAKLKEWFQPPELSLSMSSNGIIAGRMHSMEWHVEKPGVLLFFNATHCFSGDQLCRVPFFLKRLAR